MSAKGQLKRLHDDLTKLVTPDPEQEITSWAVPALAEILRDLGEAFPNDPLYQRLVDIITPEVAVSGGIRVADLLPIVGQIEARLPSAAPRVIRKSPFD